MLDVSCFEIVRRHDDGARLELQHIPRVRLAPLSDLGLGSATPATHGCSTGDLRPATLQRIAAVNTSLTHRSRCREGASRMEFRRENLFDPHRAGAVVIDTTGERELFVAAETITSHEIRLFGR